MNTPITSEQAKIIADACERPDLYERLLDPERALNAMALAQGSKSILAQGVFIFVQNLATILKRSMKGFDGADSLTDEHWLACCIFATAAQRAEAFLLTVSAGEVA